MRDRMPPKVEAKARQGSQSANDLRALAIAANGHGVTRQQKNRAAAELEQRVGRRKAQRLQDDAIRSAPGAQPKGLRRLFG